MSRLPNRETKQSNPSVNMAMTRSSITIALNGSMANACDIPKPFSSDAFTSGLAKSVPATKATRPLPTPPNSISPNLPPHGLKAQTYGSTVPVHLDAVESDFDLRDGSGSSMDSQSGFETTGSITPALLAKHHLPDILLNNGPLAIRHIMGYLTTSVPGFSNMPPAKARRLVVGALEGRGGGDGGGMNGDVKFEKVGWGRWDARLKGQPSRESRGQQSPPPSLPTYSLGMPIANNNSGERPRPNAPSSSWAGDSAIFSHEDDIDMEMEEVDKMSLDGSCSSSEAPPDDEIMGDDPEDMTDDEDWAAVGAVALRQASYNGSAPLGGRNFLNTHVYTGGSQTYGGPSLSALAKSAPLHPNQISFQRQRPSPKVDFAAFGMTSDSQEREAIEALLRLGSV